MRKNDKQKKHYLLYWVENVPCLQFFSGKKATDKNSSDCPVEKRLFAVKSAMIACKNMTSKM